MGPGKSDIILLRGRAPEPPHQEDLVQLRVISRLVDGKALVLREVVVRHPELLRQGLRHADHAADE